MSNDIKKAWKVPLAIIVLVAGVGFFLQSDERPVATQDTAMEETSADEVGVTEIADAVSVPEVTDYRDLTTREALVTEVASQLDAPWAFTWLPSGGILVTERFGSLRMVRDGELQAETISGVPEVFSNGQGGLLDVAVHSNFTENNFVYLSYAHGSNEGNRLRVARAELNDMNLENLEVIFEVGETKTGNQHFGSRFAWLPDNTLLFSVGDGGNPPLEYNGELIREQAQNLSAHLGKIIRINDDGSIPDDNPFIGRPDVNPEIYSYGHRNVQGIDYDASNNRVLASEHGSKGGDELNGIQAGENYGWPLTTFATEYDAFGTPISENQTLPGVQNPLAVWTPTIAPAEVVVYNGPEYSATGDVFVAGMLLRDNTTIAAYAFRPAGGIFRLHTNEQGQIFDQTLINVGDVRVRSIAEGPDGYLYALTDTTDRQSRPGENAGRIVRIDSW
jgi:glucose/arabinose dehydrogenase